MVFMLLLQNVDMNSRTELIELMVGSFSSGRVSSSCYLSYQQNLSFEDVGIFECLFLVCVFVHF